MNCPFLKHALRLIGWAKEYGSASASDLPLSPAASSSPRVIRFVDRYMEKGRNVLSGYDASEGALFMLFLAVLAVHPKAPSFCAVDNADHGLNPGLATVLMQHFAGWLLSSKDQRQILMTSHNPAGCLLEPDPSLNNLGEPKVPRTSRVELMHIGIR